MKELSGLNTQAWTSSSASSKMACSCQVRVSHTLMVPSGINLELNGTWLAGFVSSTSPKYQPLLHEANNEPSGLNVHEAGLSLPRNVTCSRPVRMFHTLWVKGSSKFGPSIPQET